MKSHSTTPPVLFLIFKRPSTTQKVFEAIRKARPAKLFIAADGPRNEVPGEVEKCLAARAIVESVDWECDVQTLYRTENLGCGKGVSSAITWFFEHVEEGIILEDDTLPSPTFFSYCAELLEYYRHDTRIMEISGTTLPNRLTEAQEHSYFFSNWDHIWGWATWRRAWKHYDYTMKNYPEAIRKGYFSHNYTSVYEHYYMDYLFDTSYKNNQDVSWWSVQWGFSRKINSGLVVVPLKNLVVNLGFGEDATNTTGPSTFMKVMKQENMEFPLRHPEFVVHDIVTDNAVFKEYFTTPKSRLKAMLRTFCPSGVYSFVKSIANRSFAVFLLDDSLIVFDELVLMDEYIPVLTNSLLFLHSWA